MKINSHISFKFDPELHRGVCPRVNSVCSYPLAKGRMGNVIRTIYWAVEYHSKYAGEMRLRNARESWIKREGKTVHIYAPGCEYLENTLNAELPIQESYIVFRDGPEPVLAEFIDPGCLFAKIYVEGNEMEELFSQAVGCCETYGRKAFWKAQSCLMKIIDLLSQAGKDRNDNWRISENASGYFTSFSEKVDNYLRQNVDRNLRSSDIASYMKVSESTLNHKYKKESGLAPIAKFIEIRIDFAKSLLMKGEKLKIIAKMTGFNDEYHLSKTFKKVTGASPGKYKEHIRQLI